MSPSATRSTFHEEPRPTLLDRLTLPRSVRWVARLVWTVAAVSPVLLALVPWQQNVSGTGQVVARSPIEREQVIEAPLDGRIVRWHVREADRVRAGDPLVEVSDNDPALLARLAEQRDAARGRVAAIQREVAGHEANAASLEEARRLAVEASQERVAMSEERTRAAEQGLEASRGVEVAAALHRDRQLDLAGRGIASRRAAELGEMELVRARAEVERSLAALAAARSERESLVAERDRAGAELTARAQSARASAEKASADLQAARAELARLEVGLARQETQVVRAPRSGAVVRFLVAQGGEMVKAGEPLIQFVPDSDERAVELLVDGNDAPLIAEGRHVRLQFEGWPAVQFVGWPSVAVGTFGGTVVFVDATDSGAGKFRILVVPTEAEPWPETRFLRQGVRVNAWVLLDQVALGYELWRRMNAFPQAIDSAAPKRQEPKGK